MVIDELQKVVGDQTSTIEQMMRIDAKQAVGKEGLRRTGGSQEATVKVVRHAARKCDDHHRD